MTVSFFSNFLNHHQKPVSDELFNLLGNNYTFIATSAMPDSFKKAGYPDYSKTPYLLHAYVNDETKEEALKLALDSDIVILGAAPDYYIRERLNLNKHTFRYSERVFRKGLFQKLNPRALYLMYKRHTRFRKKNYYLLCASAFTPNDLSWVYGYPNKMYKWGYFTNTEDYNINEILAKKRNDPFNLLFVARLIKLKHPEMVIYLAKKLRDKNINFRLRIIGTGVLEQSLLKLHKELNLGNVVEFVGNLSNEMVIDEMKKANILVFPSNKKEGWGAVINEAMASGCTVVASHEIGAVPYLIKPYQNGMVFKSENLNDLTNKVLELINDRELCESLASNAYTTISKEWSPKSAALNLMKLFNQKLNNSTEKIETGPCSVAHKTPQDWYIN